ncbi:TonB-dependent receptor [Derxia lacustris]|uniref:TonB-dependent receptor n=1 Tax=Derxia lacustris TaxID=764842 RepID=UPI001592B8D5|nr:TonB-dependent receptor [Derxia lacustris]
MTGAELEKTDTTGFRNILSRIGNTAATYTNPQAGSLMIRGLGWASGAGPLDPSVGVNVDGVSYGVSGLAASIAFADLDSVEVFRGPQGTQGGKGGSVGEIVIRTREPSFRPESSVSITYGQLNTLNSRATIGGGIVEDLLAWRGTVLREQADGPYRNANDPNWSYKNTDRTYGRAQFLLTPGNGVKALLSLDYSPKSKEFSDNYVNFNRPTPTYYDSRTSNGSPIRVDQAGEPIGKLSRRWFAQEASYGPNDYTANQINRLSQNPNNYGSRGVSAKIDWSLGEQRLTSISAYRSFYFDSGGGPISVFDIDRSPSTGHVEYQQYSQELRLASADDAQLGYQTGLYFFRGSMPERWTTARFGSDAGAYYATPAQYTRLDADSAGRGLLLNSLDRLFTKTRDSLDNRSYAWYGNLRWRASDALGFAGGLRLTQESRSTESSRFIVDQGYGAGLNPVAINNVALGGFNSDAATGTLASGNSAAQIALADSVAQKYFGVQTYAGLTGDQQRQVAAAKAIRRARIGSVYGSVEAQGFRQLLPTANFSTSYRIDDDLTTYASWQHGEKAGISQIVGATAGGGTSVPVKAERSNAFEVGLKSSLLEHTLALNAGLYLHNVRDYIQPLYFYDAAQTAANNDGRLAYASGLGNVPKVQARGLELDASYDGFSNFDIRLAGAYNDARYKDFRFLAKPAELGGTSTPYYDATGKTLPGSAKLAFNLFVGYSQLLTGDVRGHADLNYRYTTSYNNDPSLSRYAVVGANGLVDLALGLGHRDKSFDATLLVRNLLNSDTGFYSNWNTFYPSNPRWVGINLTARQ